MFFKYKQDGVLDKNRTIDNVQKHNIYSWYERLKSVPYLGLMRSGMLWLINFFMHKIILVTQLC
jgi:hypothetical protein